MFVIQSGVPLQQMGGYGFNIKLYPSFKESVSMCELNQERVNKTIERLGRGWLDACGFDAKMSSDKKEFLYSPQDIRVSWGEWGPEHISVPGDACGLDICGSTFGAPRGGNLLGPHNVDGIRQAYLLMLVFNYFAELILLDRG